MTETQATAAVKPKLNGVVLRPFVAAMVIVGSFVVFGFVARGFVDPAWRTEVNLVVGACIVLVTKIVDYCFATTVDSGKKTEIIAERSAR